MNIISKFSSATPSVNQQRSPEPPSPATSPTPRSQNNAHISWSATGLSVPGSLDTSNIGLTENQLRRQALECLTSVLRSLVAWGTAVNKGPDEGAGPPSTRSQAEEPKRDVTPSDSNMDRLSAPSSSSVEALRQTAPTPDIDDDPLRFESARQKKTTLLEGIKKFNLKPKRVSQPISSKTIFISYLIRVSNSLSNLGLSKALHLQTSRFSSLILMD